MRQKRRVMWTDNVIRELRRHTTPSAYMITGTATSSCWWRKTFTTGICIEIEVWYQTSHKCDDFLELKKYPWDLRAILAFLIVGGWVDSINNPNYVNHEIFHDTNQQATAGKSGVGVAACWMRWVLYHGLQPFYNFYGRGTCLLEYLLYSEVGPGTVSTFIFENVE